MRNPELATDFVRRASVRLRVLDLLVDAESWPDVVREAQEAVELALKGLLRAFGVEPPRLHDVSGVLEAERERFPQSLCDRLGELKGISRELRRDRELAFYGAEDLVPGDFYTREDAEHAREAARTVIAVVTAHVG